MAQRWSRSPFQLCGSNTQELDTESDEETDGGLTQFKTHAFGKCARTLYHYSSRPFSAKKHCHHCP